MKLIKKYFPTISKNQIDQYQLLIDLFKEFNAQVNMISRNDIDNLEERHILHSLSIAKFINFKPQTRIVDIGTGGGFPGLPLAIMFPDCQFYLVDSIGKKIKVVDELIIKLGLKNVQAINSRVESLKYTFDFAISRAVAPITDLYNWSHKLLEKKRQNEKPNGFILLKGGDLTAEINNFKKANNKGYKINEVALELYFTELFFDSKKLIYFKV